MHIENVWREHTKTHAVGNGIMNGNGLLFLLLPPPPRAYFSFIIKEKKIILKERTDMHPSKPRSGSTWDLPHVEFSEEKTTVFLEGEMVTTPTPALPGRRVLVLFPAEPTPSRDLPY